MKYLQKIGPNEKATLEAVFEKCGDAPDSSPSSSYVERVLSQKVRKVDSHVFGELSWVPSTSNVPERHFSVSRYILNDYRKKLNRIHFESQLFLMMNRNFWNAHLVSKLQL